MEIGAQLFTVRDFCKNLDDFSLTLAKIADIGYKHVQVSGTCAYPAEWLRDELAKNGLTCVLTHTPAARLLEETEQVCREHDVFGCKYIGLGYYAFAPAKEKYSEFCAQYAPVAEKIAAGGNNFMYHNMRASFKRSTEKRCWRTSPRIFPRRKWGSPSIPTGSRSAAEILLRGSKHSRAECPASISRITPTDRPWLSSAKEISTLTAYLPQPKTREQNICSSNRTSATAKIPLTA